MHKRNLALLSMLIALVITLGVWQWNGLHRSLLIGVFYFPAIILSLLLSGRTHSPGAVAQWSSFIVYTLLYVVICLIVYALLLEFYLLRRGFGHLAEDPGGDGSEAGNRAALDGLGRAILEVERRRRAHWLLDASEGIDLSASPEVVGARALEGAARAGPADGILREVKRRLVRHRGAQGAEAEVARWRTSARASAARDGRTPPA